MERGDLFFYFSEQSYTVAIYIYRYNVHIYRTTTSTVMLRNKKELYQIDFY